jgi:hypothetical protein
MAPKKEKLSRRDALAHFFRAVANFLEAVDALENCWPAMASLDRDTALRTLKRIRETMNNWYERVQKI